MKTWMRALTAVGLTSLLVSATFADDGHHRDHDNGSGSQGSSHGSGGGNSHSSGGSSGSGSHSSGGSWSGGGSHSSGGSWSSGSGHSSGGGSSSGTSGGNSSSGGSTHGSGSWGSSGGSTWGSSGSGSHSSGGDSGSGDRHHTGGSWGGSSGSSGSGTHGGGGSWGGSSGSGSSGTHSSGGSWGGSSGSGSGGGSNWDQGDHGIHDHGGGQGSGSGTHGSGGQGGNGTHGSGDGGHSAPGSWDGQGSHSGGGHYGGSNNNNNGGHGTTIHSGGNTITFGHGNEHNQVWRSDHLHFVHNDWRRGYWGYDHGFRDDFFFFGFYAFDPFGSRCVVSPWYCYPNLPGYLSYDRVLFFGCAPIVFAGDPYAYHPVNGYYRDDRYNDVDYAVDDLSTLFNRADRRAANRLVPRYDNVNIFVDGQYSYSISSNDFYDMLVDNATSTRTTSYTIEHVWRNRDGARVIARHEFEDPRGGTCTVWQSFVMEYERGNLVVREFGTSSNRPE